MVRFECVPSIYVSASVRDGTVRCSSPSAAAVLLSFVWGAGCKGKRAHCRMGGRLGAGYRRGIFMGERDILVQLQSEGIGEGHTCNNALCSAALELSSLRGSAEVPAKRERQGSDASLPKLREELHHDQTRPHLPPRSSRTPRPPSLPLSAHGARHARFGDTTSTWLTSTTASAASRACTAT